jgi:type I restriction enzyme S subunit
LYKHWFVDFEFPNEEGKPYKSSGGEMIDSELGLIPKGWLIKKISNIADVVSGKRPKNIFKNGSETYKYPILGASGIMAYSDDYNMESKCLVIGRVGTHGVIQRVNEKSWASDNTLVIRSVYLEFVYQILKKIDYKSINRGSNQPLITQTDIKNTNIFFPSNSLINKFEKKISIIFDCHYNCLKQNIILLNLRDLLLPKLMSGEIEVPDME